MVLTFESMAPPSSREYKSGTLHIPIPYSVYSILSANGRGNIDRPWNLQELQSINDPLIAKLVRIIKRYQFGVSMRKGLIEQDTLTVLPLTIFRSPKSALRFESKILFLCGDANSTCIYQRGINKGFLETLKCAEIMDEPMILQSSLDAYNEYCEKLFKTEQNLALSRGQKIESSNKSISLSSQIIGLGLLTLIGGMLYKSSLK